jgi:hypothetical protein
MMREFTRWQPRLPSPRRRRCLQVIWTLALIAPASILQADTIYKSMDANGNVVYSDHVDPSLTQTSIVHLEDPRYPPHEMHVCWTNCFTLVLDRGVYRRADGVDETWTVETFTAKSVVLHRRGTAIDRNGLDRDATYAGQVANDRLVGVTVNGKPASGIDASWGAALNTLPGSNAERDAPRSAEPPALPGGAPPAPSDADVESGADATVNTTVAPPPLREEPQPAATEVGTSWTPGYWYWGGQGYSWIPGAWVRPPRAPHTVSRGHGGAVGALVTQPTIRSTPPPAAAGSSTLRRAPISLHSDPVPAPTIRRGGPLKAPPTNR